jgi:hypothetical protein
MFFGVFSRDLIPLSCSSVCLLSWKRDLVRRLDQSGRGGELIFYKIISYWSAGSFLDRYWSADKYAGNLLQMRGEVNIAAPYDKIPVFQKGGTIVPRRERVRR